MRTGTGRIIASWTGAVLVLGGSSGALAQTSSDAAPPSEEKTESLDQLGEIVVTARKRAENLQDTPVAVTAITGNDLTERSVRVIQDIAAQTPSLAITQMSYSASTSSLSLRGLAYPDVRLNADLTVGVYVDGVYMPRSIGLDAGDLTDIERIEVLKGPQGTLFGRNTTGGALNIVTKVPVNRVEGSVSARLGSHGDYGVSGVLNLPLGETLSARIVANASGRDGFGTNSFNGAKLGRRESYLLRGAISWEPAPDVTVTFRGDYTKADVSNLGWRPVMMIAGSTANRVVAAETGLSLTAARDLYLSYAVGNPQDATTNIDSAERFHSEGGSITAQFQLNDHVELKSITAYRSFNRFSNADLDGSPFRIFEYVPFTTTDHQWSEEVQLNGSAFDKRLNWILGGYWSKEAGRERGVQYNSVAISTSAPTIIGGLVENGSLGAFAQGTFRFNDWLSATAGLRYTHDTRDLVSINQTRTVCTALGVTLAALGNEPCTRTLPTLSTNALSYVFSLEFRPAEDIFVYTKTSRGYRSGGQALTGGSAISAAAATTSYLPFRPEFVTDYEIGLKSEWFDRKLRVNLAAYHANYNNIQRAKTILVPGTTTVVSVTENVAKAVINGLEAEVTALPLRGLELNATLALTYPRYTDYVVNGVDLSSTPFYITSKVTYSMSAAYTAKLRAASLRAQLDYSHNSEIRLSGLLGVRRPVGLLNSRLTLSLDRYDADFSVFARNLTNEVYAAHQTDISSLGVVVGIVAQPRTWGVEFTQRF